MKTFRPCLQTLPHAQKDILPQLKPCAKLGFTLYGGTAIALQLGHRPSLDFDFFSFFPLDMQKTKQLFQTLPFLSNAQLIQEEPNTRGYITEHGVKLSFFGDITFGRVGDPIMTEKEKILVASLDDLMATKLAVISQRVEAKDYQDIAALLRCGMTLEQGLCGASALYGKQFSPSISLKTMTFFQGGDLEILSLEDKQILLNAVQNLHQSNFPPLKILCRDLAGDTCLP